MRLTLGPQVKGKGHFFTMRSFFSSRESNDAASVDLSLDDSRPTGHTFSTRPSLTDVEPGSLAGRDGVASVRERMEA